MASRRAVFELDTESILRDLQESLISSGYEVTERVPEGIWWLSSSRPREAAAQDIVRELERLVAEGLHEIEQ
ncbi:MAG TPA: hypothetical protein VF898_13160 [Chloroflexota bacterium]